ncbi:D-alanyl-D-alanine carboxypeptidase dacA [Salmonella enterica subsp. enterica serovar Typhimurium]|nr:D-alanyl-D-alanine carboxypeptidase dacA [Salmonella enterica subsp. enterica serovar Typhimurium]
MFLKPGMQVPVSQLIRGINLQSGNDACVAMADFAAGSQDAFVGLMNSYVNALGLKKYPLPDRTRPGRRRTIQFSSRYGADWSGVNSRCAERICRL